MHGTTGLGGIGRQAGRCWDHRGRAYLLYCDRGYGGYEEAGRAPYHAAKLLKPLEIQNPDNGAFKILKFSINLNS